MKFPLRPSLKASFLHDEEIDWDALGTLEDSARYGAASPNADELDGAAATNYLEGLKSEHETGAAGKAGGEARKIDGSSKIDSSHVDSSGRRRSSVTFDDINDSLRSYGLGSHPGSLSDLGRRPSVSTLAASHSSKSRSPHELAAAVAKEVKDDFAKKLPSSLCKEFDRRDVVAPYSSKEIVLGPLLGKGEFSYVFLQRVGHILDATSTAATTTPAATAAKKTTTRAPTPRATPYVVANATNKLGKKAEAEPRMRGRTDKCRAPNSNQLYSVQSTNDAPNRISCPPRSK